MLNAWKSEGARAIKVLSVSCTLGMQIGMLVPDLLQEQWVLDIGVGEKGRERERD